MRRVITAVSGDCASAGLRRSTRRVVSDARTASLTATKASARDRFTAFSELLREISGLRARSLCENRRRARTHQCSRRTNAGSRSDTQNSRRCPSTSRKCWHRRQTTMSTHPSLRVRRSLQELQDDYTKGDKKALEDLMRAWQGIKALPPDDPRSFYVLAATMVSRSVVQVGGTRPIGAATATTATSCFPPGTVSMS